MNWKQQLFKPKWRHKDPEIRREAVSNSLEPELLQALAEIMRSDEDAGVRIAAARRIQAPQELLSALDSESDDLVRSTLSERLKQLAASSAPDRPPLPDRLGVVAALDERGLLEAVAASAPESELRAAALRKIERQGFLGDRAIADPDPELRRLAAAGITQQSTLKRVIAACRTSDKGLHQELTERLHGELVASGNRDAIRREALAVCEALEAYLRATRAPTPDDLQQLEQRWKVIETQAPDTLTRRFQHDWARLQAPQEPPAAVRDSAAPEPPRPEPEEIPAVRADAGLTKALQAIHDSAGRDIAPGRKRIDQLADHLQRAWSAIKEPGGADQKLKSEGERQLQNLRAAAEERRARLDGALEHARGLLDQLRDALEEGELHNALKHRAELHSIGTELKRDKGWKTIQTKLNATLGRLRELRDWQHWANDKIRKRLITEMEALPAAGLHPDAVLERSKSLQAEWKTLEESEQIPGDRHYAAAPWMWRKFNAAGRQAFQLTKPFLDKRSEVQAKHLDEMRAVAERLATLATAEPPDWKALGESMAQARKALRSLSSLPGRARQKMAKRLKRALEAGNTAMQAHYAEIEKQKIRLIREAAQVQHLADREEAIQRAKALQAEWKAAGSLWRSRENELWREFRAPLDPLFKALDSEREAVQAEQAERRAEQETVCQQLEEWLQLDKDEALLEHHGRVQGLVNRWRELGRADRRLHERFESALKQFRARERALQNAAADRVRARWWQKAELLHELEISVFQGTVSDQLRKRLETDWPESHSDDTEIDQRLAQRLRAALDGKTPSGAPEDDSGDVVEAARKICIDLEFLAGLTSPDEEKELRMQYQVERLSASMSGERERISARKEAQQLEQAWLCHACLPDDDYHRFKTRVRRALNNILEE